MNRFLLTSIGVLLLNPTVAFATGDHEEERDGCDHGRSGKECRPDPQPDRGKDCEEHGNHGGVNEDHCGTTTTTGPIVTLPTLPTTTTTQPPATTTTTTRPLVTLPTLPPTTVPLVTVPTLSPITITPQPTTTEVHEPQTLPKTGADLQLLAAMGALASLIGLGIKKIV